MPPLIYTDALQDDEELSKLVSALNLGTSTPQRPQQLSTSTSPQNPHPSQKNYSIHSPTQTGLSSRWSEASHHTQGKDGFTRKIKTPSYRPTPASRTHAPLGSAAPMRPALPPPRSSEPPPPDSHVYGQGSRFYVQQSIAPASLTVLPYMLPSPYSSPYSSSSEDFAIRRGGEPHAQDLVVTASPSISPSSPTQTSPTSITPQTKTANKKRGKGRRKTYAVYQGLEPGIYESWSDVEPLVSRVSGNIHESFLSRYDAERAYTLAYALGAVRRLGGNHTLAPPTAPPAAFMDALRNVRDDFLGADWHVVYKGKQPGVYPSWAFAANQAVHVPNASFEKYSSRADAQAAFDIAVAEGETQVL